MDNELMVITNQIIEIENKLAMVKELEKQRDEFKAQLKKAMEDYGVPKWSTPNGVKITLIEDVPDEMVIKTTYNEPKFQEENKELWHTYLEIHEKYKEKNEVLQKGKKGYVRITLPKVKEDIEDIPF